MTRLRIIGLLMAIWCTPSYAQLSAQELMIWLEPLTYQEMREMRERAKEMAKSQMGDRSGARQSDSKNAAGEERKKRGWGSDGQRLRRIYLRSGPFPARKRKMGGGRMSGSRPQKMESNASGSMVWLEQPDNTIQGIEVKQRNSVFRADYPADAGGWYRIFAYNDLGVRDNSRVHLFSYYTFMSHGDEVDEEAPGPITRDGYFEGSPELELVRVYDDDEERYRDEVGRKIRVRALFRGKPVVGRLLALITQQDWRQVQTTDANGEAVFTLIKEDFHEDGIDRRKSELYLLRLEHRIENAGEYQGASYGSERYIATLPFRVSPPRDDWQSQRMAYLVAMIAIVGAAVAIAVRRRRRRQK